MSTLRSLNGRWLKNGDDAKEEWKEAFWMKKKSLTDVVEQSRIATELPPFSSL